MDKSTKSAKAQRLQFYEYTLLASAAYPLLVLTNHVFNWSGQIPFISAKFATLLSNLLSYPIIFFIATFLLLFIPYYSEAKLEDKKHHSKVVKNQQRLYRIFFIFIHIAVATIAICSPLVLNHVQQLAIVGIAFLIWYWNYGLLIHALKHELPFFNPVWNVLINLRDDEVKEDGYDSLKKRAKKLNKPIIGHKGKDFAFEHSISTTKSTVINGNPRRANIVRGIAGSGKTFSCLNPFGIQTIQKDIPTFTYDFKFPDMTKVMLAAYMNHKASNNLKCKMAINVMDNKYLHNSWRLSPVNNESIQTELHADVYMQTFFTTMKKEWINKPDFWAESTFAYTAAIAIAHKRYFGDHFNLGHILLFLTRNYKEQVMALSNLGDQQIDQKIENIRRPVVENTGGDQLSGIFSTMQNFISKMNNPFVFYNITGNDLSMDLNNPDRPSHLCMGNTNFFSKVFSPIISLYSKLAFTICNDQGKLPFHYLCDEAATIFLDGIDQFINTGRSNGMIASIGIQTDAQIDYSYGRELARLLKSSIGNQYSGQIKDEETQRLVSNAMGSYKTTQKNKSSANGKSSYSTSTVTEKYIRPEELGSLDVGYMVGQVTEGEHKRFMGQFDVSRYLSTYDQAKSMVLPLSPTVMKLSQNGEISKDTISQYYQGNADANLKINQLINAYAQSEYDKTVKEANQFFNSLI